MKITVILSVISIILIFCSSCNDKKLMAQNGDQVTGTLASDQNLVAITDTASPAPKITQDTLQFKEKLELTLFNRNINKFLLSRHVSTSTARFPDVVLEHLGSAFYRNLQESGNESYFREKAFSINDVQLYETTNYWYIYIIFLGSQYETTAYMAGCFNQNNKNYILKDAFGDQCATYTFRAPDLTEKGLLFSVYENYACQEGHEEIYINTFAVTPDTLLHERKTLTPAEITELFALSN